MFIGDTAEKYPKPDGKYIFDKLSSVYISGNATRDDAPNHIRSRPTSRARSPRPGSWMCPAGVYEIPDDAVLASRSWRGRRDRQLHQLRPMRRDHRQGRTADRSRGWRRAALHDRLGPFGPWWSGPRPGWRVGRPSCCRQQRALGCRTVNDRSCWLAGVAGRTPYVSQRSTLVARIPGCLHAADRLDWVVASSGEIDGDPRLEAARVRAAGAGAEVDHGSRQGLYEFDRGAAVDGRTSDQHVGALTEPLLIGDARAR